MPKKFISCVEKVSAKNLLLPESKQVNPYAVCRVSTGYTGTTHHAKKKR